MAAWELANDRAALTFAEDRGRLALRGLAAGGVDWLAQAGAAGLFAVWVNGTRYDAASLTLAGFGVEGTAALARLEGPGFAVEAHWVLYPGTALVETWPVIIRTGGAAVRIGRADSLALNLPAGPRELQYFESDWGREFSGRRAPLAGAVTLETRFGRSSKGMHPWFGLSSAAGMLAGAVAWSGNWAARFEPLAGGGWQVSAGLNDWEFFKDLPPGAAMEAPHVLLAAARDLDDAAQQYTRAGREHWYPRSPLAQKLPVEWNPWWSYTDQDIHEGVFRANVDAAARLGVELCTLDAGWFGPDESGAQWYAYRGDWDRVNRARFPGGLRALSDHVHRRGMAFGLWCEIEGLGEKARLLRDHSQFAARRGEQFLGYVCLGSPAAQEWAYQTLCRLIAETGCDWLKLDFNVDPGPGCNRADHGHGPGDGLFEHVLGYYRVLDRLRAAFPDVVLENCSSGGLRIDLGMARHTHLTFLSDPDWPEHSLQVFWGASAMLAAETCLHWSFSEWSQPDRPPQQDFDPRGAGLDAQALERCLRIAMLGAFGLSQKLPDLPGWAAEELAAQIGLYRSEVREFVRAGALYRLGPQPDQDGGGPDWCAFQYSLGASRHLILAFGLFGRRPDCTLFPRGLDPDGLYRVSPPQGDGAPRPGRAWMQQGVALARLSSAVVRIDAAQR